MAPEMAGALLTIAALVLALIGEAVMLLAARDKLQAVKAQAAADVQRMANDSAYWKTRCEQLTDAALIRAGAIPGPVMADQKPAAKDPMTRMLSGMAVTEIDSTRKGQG